MRLPLAFRRALYALAASLRPRRAERELREEMELHVELQTRKHLGRGLDPAAARALAEHEFGDAARHRDAARDERGGWAPFHGLGQDLRYAARGLARSPAFALASVVVLALGIGATTAVFSVVNGVLLRPLPYPESGRLVTLWSINADGNRRPVAYADFAEWRDRARALESAAAFYNPPATVLGGSEAARVRVLGVTRDYYSLLGARPALGRLFLPDEFEHGAAVAVVSDAFWRRYLAADPDPTARVLRVEGRTLSIVGVLAPDVRPPYEGELFFPLDDAALRVRGPSTSAAASSLQVIARLRPAVPVERARAELNALAADMRRQYGAGTNAVAVRTITLRDELVGEVRRPLYVLLGAAALVLLVGCANVAGTLIARGVARRQELAVRASIGASAGRIARQLLTESAVLAAAGGAAGVALGAALVRTAGAYAASVVPRADEVRLDARAVLAALLASCLATAIFGILPALSAAGVDPGAVLRGGGPGRGTDSRRRRLMWRALVGAEVALTLLLLAGSGLLLKSFRRLSGASLGFDPRGVLTAALDVPEATHPTDESVAALAGRVLGEAAALPGATDAGVVNFVPLGIRDMLTTVTVDRSGAEPRPTAYRVASGGYFGAMGIPLVRGRTFRDDAPAQERGVALVNQTLARRWGDGADPVGRTLRLGDETFTVVGVVGDVYHDGRLFFPKPELYLHYATHPSRDLVVVVRGRDPEALAAPLRERVRAIDQSVPTELATMDALVERTLGDRRLTMVVLAGFALIALALAAVGTYGVVAYSVTRRTHEIGIRIALGAEPARVRRLVMRDAMAMVGAGVAAGTMAALPLTTLLQNLLFEVNPADPATAAAVVALLLGVAWLASWLPARRASAVDPVAALRGD